MISDNKHVICSSTADIDKVEKKAKKQVILVADCVTAMIVKRKTDSEKLEGFVAQPTVALKGTSFSKVTTYVTFLVQKECVEAFSDKDVRIGVYDLLNWAYKQAEKRRNIIVVNGFESVHSNHLDILVFKDGVLIDIRERRGLVKSKEGFTRALVDEITAVRTEELRNHTVFVAGNVCYLEHETNDLEGLLSDCSLDKDVFQEVTNVHVVGMNPYKTDIEYSNQWPFIYVPDIKVVRLLEERSKKDSILIKEALLFTGLVTTGLLLFSGVEGYSNASFDGQKASYDELKSLSAELENEYGALSLWQKRDNYLRANATKDSNVEALKMVLLAISGASIELPNLEVKIKKFEVIDGDEFSVEIGLVADSLDEAYDKGRLLNASATDHMTGFAGDVEVRGAPRHQQLNGSWYYFFTFNGTFKRAAIKGSV